jgi:protein-disulfide isomerase
MKKWLLNSILLLLTIGATPVILAELALNSVTPKIATDLYNPRGNAIAGNPEGTITLVELFDYNCHFCREFQPTLQKIITQNHDLRVVYKEYLVFGDTSLPATSAVFAAHTQGQYLNLHNALLKATKPLDKNEVLRIAKQQGINIEKLQAAMASPKIQQQIAQNADLVDALMLDSVPVFIITSSRLAKDPQQINLPQYLYMGSEDAKENIQQLINKVRQG